MNSYNISFSLDFRRNKEKGKYIVFEGIDGAGKTVQLERAAEYLKSQGIPYLVVSEPRRTGAVGHVINEVLQKRIKLPPTSLQYLFSADRIAHQQEVIIPALTRGEYILSHRNFWSAVPYGIMDHANGKPDFSMGYTILVAQSILSMYHQMLIPDMTVFLDVPSDVAMNRIKKTDTEPEYYETREKLEQISNAYAWLVEKFPREFTVIDGNTSVDDVAKAVAEKIGELQKL